jgi:thiol-disulfide isomerase/thioredoxin
MRGTARTWAIPATLALLLSGVAAASVLAYRHLERPDTGGSSLATLSMTRLDGHGVMRVGDFKGRPLVLNFFASWCPACVSELPTFERASQDYRGRIAFLGIDEQDDPSAGLRLAQSAKVTFPLVRDTNDNRLFRLVHGAGMPTSVFLAPDGSVWQTYSGPLSDDLLRQRLDELAAIQAGRS